jgi:2-oxoglutarate ferredoxin oxidoreductase subunit alpha
MPVIAATSPTDCFESAYLAAKIAVEHMTPVILLSDAFIANGSAAWKLPNLAEYPEIKPNYVTPEMSEGWSPYKRNPDTLVRYWAVPGTPGFMHRIGGLEKNDKTGAICNDPDNHHLMVEQRAQKIERIADTLPPLKVEGDADAELLIVGFGGTYGHLHEAMLQMCSEGKKVAHAHLNVVNPLPRNTQETLARYKKVVVAEQNMGQLAAFLRMKTTGANIIQYNEVKGQPFNVATLVDAFTKIMEE